MYYVQKDLNDPSKIKVEKRKPDANTICPAPKDDEGNYITDADILDIIDAQDTHMVPVYEKDQNGELIVDDNGEYIPVLDGNGDQVYEEKVLRTYKKAVVNPEKKRLKELDKAAKEAEEKAKKDERDERRNSLKLLKAKVKDLKVEQDLKDILTGLIEEVVGE